MSESKPSLRRGLQFSLRSLLLMMLLAAIFLGGRESGRRRLEAERKRANDERLKAEAAVVQAEQASRRANLAILRLQFHQADNDLRRAEQQMKQANFELEMTNRKYLNAVERLRPQQLTQLPRDTGWWLTQPLSGSATDRVVPRPRAVLINEYWRRKKPPRQFGVAPEWVERMSSVA